MATTTHNPRVKEEDRGNNPMEKAKDVGSQAMEKAKDMGSQAVEKAKEAVASVGEMAGKAVSAVGKKADDLTATAGSDIKKWGDTLSEKSSHEGLVGHASQAVANTLKESGHYLEEAKLSGMADDVTEVIKRNPVPAVLIGFGIGFLLGRALRS